MQLVYAAHAGASVEVSPGRGDRDFRNTCSNVCRSSSRAAAIFRDARRFARHSCAFLRQMSYAPCTEAAASRVAAAAEVATPRKLPIEIGKPAAACDTAAVAAWLDGGGHAAEN